jgi:hypothetical protein
MRKITPPLVAVAVAVAVAFLGPAAGAAGKDSPPAAKEMAKALATLNQSLGLQNYPEPHCLVREFGKMIKPEQVKACAETTFKDRAPYPELGKSYVLVVLMAEVGPSTVVAVSTDHPGWAVLSCDPGKPCPARKAGDDKMGKRVVDRLDRACKNATTVWFPERKGCP